MPLAGSTRIALLIVGLIIAVCIGSLFARTQPLFRSPLEVPVTTRTAVLPTSTSEVSITICEPDDQASACRPGELDPSQNLADPGNGPARPAVSKDARPGHQAQYANDGRADTSWVSNSANSWMKLDLGQIRTINRVSLETGNLVSSRYDDFGQFVIMVALSDVYADGDSSDDDREYTTVFRSEQADFGGTISDSAMINIRFAPAEARYVKITFERAGAAIEEIGVFMMEPPVLAEQPTTTPDLPGLTLTPTPTRWYATRTSTSIPDEPPDDPPAATAAPSQTPVSTPQPSNTPVPLPTNTQPPADTATPVPTDPLPTLEPPPTVIIPTEILPTVELSSESPDLSVVTESD